MRARYTPLHGRAWTYLPQPPQLLQVHLVLDVAEKVGLPGGTTTEKELEVTALLNDRLDLILRQHTETRVGSYLSLTNRVSILDYDNDVYEYRDDAPLTLSKMPRICRSSRAGTIRSSAWYTASAMVARPPDLHQGVLQIARSLKGTTARRGRLGDGRSGAGSGMVVMGTTTMGWRRTPSRMVEVSRRLEVGLHYMIGHRCSIRASHPCMAPEMHEAPEQQPKWYEVATGKHRKRFKRPPGSGLGGI